MKTFPYQQNFLCKQEISDDKILLFQVGKLYTSIEKIVTYDYTQPYSQNLKTISLIKIMGENNKYLVFDESEISLNSGFILNDYFYTTAEYRELQLQKLI